MEWKEVLWIASKAEQFMSELPQIFTLLRSVGSWQFRLVRLFSFTGD